MAENADISSKEQVSKDVVQPKPRKTLCGYLNIHNKTGLLKSYKSRWFVYCDDAGRLLYYKTKGDTKPDGNILITHATFTFDVKDKPGVFEIRVGDAVTVLEANDREEMFTWLQELQTRRKEITQKQNYKIKSYVTDSDGTIINGESAESKPVDAHPHIVLTEHTKTEKSPPPAAMSKFSQNISKAADSAKQRLTAMLQRKSSEICATCIALEEELQVATENARLAKEELEANQAVLKMLHGQTDLLTEQIHILQNAKKIYSDPEMANQVDQETENLRLRHKVEELIKESKKLTSENQSLETQVASLQERQSMCEETILAKDNVIMSLSEQLEKSAGPAPSSPLVEDIFTESFHESVKDKLEAYELQNKFLNKEIVELHSVRLEDGEKMDDLHRKNIELEAKFYQLQSKYLLVLNEMNKPKISDDGQETHPPDELMGQLLDEAMRMNQDNISNSEPRDSLSSSFKAVKQYDCYGFEIEGWADDAMVQAANFQSKSEQLVATVHESPESMSLRVKWENFLAVMSTQEIHRSAEFKNLIRSGIPSNHRERVWNILIKIHVGKFQKTVGPEYYERLEKKHSKNRHNPVAKQIELDLNRTLPNNKYFEDESSEGIPKLRRVLLAYSYHNPTIGYCQGMNRVAAFALLFLKEEDAFWCLVAIIDFIMPPDYFSVSMVAAQADQRVLREILNDKIPNVTKHLESLEMDVSLFSFNWFLTLFIENIPTPTVLRIWDAFLFEGIKILFRYATAFFKFSEEGILKCRDYLSANQYLRELGSKMINTEKIAFIAFNNLNPFPIRMIHTKRALYLEQVKAELRELNALREEIKSQRAHLDYDSEDDDFENDDDEVAEDSNGPDTTSTKSAEHPGEVSTETLIEF